MYNTFYQTAKVLSNIRGKYNRFKNRSRGEVKKGSILKKALFKRQKLPLGLDLLRCSND